MIRCFIFDLDGTLFETKEANFRAYKKAFHSVGIELLSEHYDKLFGLRIDGLLREIAPEITEDEKKEIIRKKAIYYREFVQLVRPNRALINFMLSMRKSNKICLVTTASKINATFILEHFDIKEIFDVCIWGEDVKLGKPDPECYLTCLERCSIPSDECLVFEDSEVGIEAASKAGLLNVIRVLFDEK